jgi:hypothetical protein
MNLSDLANNDSAETSHNRNVNRLSSDKAHINTILANDPNADPSVENSKQNSSVNTKRESFKHKLKIKEFNKSSSNKFKSKVICKSRGTNQRKFQFKAG